MREASLKRESSESRIEVNLNLDGTGKSEIATGVGFFDHMLALFAFNAKIDLGLKARGDLNVDDHHTVEDVGIVLGQALKQALGEKKGIARYGYSLLPMDEALARVVLDISGRPFLVFSATFTKEQLGDLATEMIKEFFRALSVWAGLTLHMEIIYGVNNHHMAEALFKCFGQALFQAKKETGSIVPSTKGFID